MDITSYILGKNSSGGGGQGETSLFATTTYLEGTLPIEEIKASDFPSGITAIRPYLLYNITGLKKITIPSTVSLLQAEAFRQPSSKTGFDLVSLPTTPPDASGFRVFYNFQPKNIYI